MSDRQKTLLVILDGWGERKDASHNAIYRANTPFFDLLRRDHPHALLDASGAAVGLPSGQSGNSEVGHLTIGAGAILDTDIVRINKSINDGDFFKNPAFQHVFLHTLAHRSTLHLIGLVSPGGIHSHQEHAFALLDAALAAGVKHVVLHVITDGRDTPPRSASKYIAEFKRRMDECGVGRVGSVIGRYFAMDRDQNWDRVAIAERAFFEGAGAYSYKTDAMYAEALREQYATGITDEHIKPIVFEHIENENKGIVSNDGIIFFNFRADRARMLARRIVEFASGRNIATAGMTRYDSRIPLRAAFPPIAISKTIARVLADAGRTQTHIAETEKYAHVTYFLNGGLERIHASEKHVLIESNKAVATHDLAPEMRADEITKAIISEMEDGTDCIIANYANADMVGHTGNADATVRAVETIDAALAVIIGTAKYYQYATVITSDHGNAEVNIDPETGEMHTAHTGNPVPCLVIGAHGTLRASGGLRDVAPTVLDLMDIPKPIEMTGESLII